MISLIAGDKDLVLRPRVCQLSPKSKVKWNASPTIFSAQLVYQIGIWSEINFPQ